MRDIKRMNKLSQEEFHDTPGNRRKENGRRARRKDSRTRAIRTGLKQNVGLDQKSSKAQYLAGRPTDIPYTHNLDTNPTMFYEFSIQYDDPVITMFRETSPVSDMLYFNVTHAYPNWIPPHYPRLLTENKPPEPGEKATMDSSSSTNSFLTFSKFKHSLSARNDTERTDELSSYMALQYHRYIHLFHSYFDTYEPRDTTNLPQHSVTALAVKLLAPFVPQGNWTNGGTPPAPNEFFYRAFPKVSPDFDNDYHNRNPGVFWGWFYLSRWLPDLIQRVLFPLDQMVYNSNVNGIGTDAKAGVEKNASYSSTSIQEEVLKNTPNARKLTGKQTPTKVECALCERFDGVKIWNKNGEWFCIYKEKFEELEGKNRSASEREDCQGNGESKDTAYFHSFNEFIRWRTSYSNKLLDLEKKAYCAGDMAEMENLEKEIRDVKSAASSSDHIKSNYIVSVKG